MPFIIPTSQMSKTKVLSYLEETVFELEPKPIPAASDTKAEFSTVMFYQKQLENQSSSQKRGGVGDVALEAFSRWTEWKPYV